MQIDCDEEKLKWRSTNGSDLEPSSKWKGALRTSSTEGIIGASSTQLLGCCESDTRSRHSKPLYRFRQAIVSLTTLEGGLHVKEARAIVVP